MYTNITFHARYKSSESVKRNKKYILIKFKPGIAYKGKKERSLWSENIRHAEAWESALHQALARYNKLTSDHLAIPTAEPIVPNAEPIIPTAEQIIPTAEPIITARAAPRTQANPGQLRLPSA